MLSCVRLMKPIAERTAPTSMATFAETTPFSRNFPAGYAIRAWKKAQMDSSQKVSDIVQPWASRTEAWAAP